MEGSVVLSSETLWVLTVQQEDPQVGLLPESYGQTSCWKQIAGNTLLPGFVILVCLFLFPQMRRSLRNHAAGVKWVSPAVTYSALGQLFSTSSTREVTIITTFQSPACCSVIFGNKIDPKNSPLLPPNLSLSYSEACLVLPLGWLDFNKLSHFHVALFFTLQFYFCHVTANRCGIGSPHFLICSPL